MNINILRYSLFGIAGGQDVDPAFVKCIKLRVGVVDGRSLLV